MDLNRTLLAISIATLLVSCGDKEDKNSESTEDRGSEHNDPSKDPKLGGPDGNPGKLVIGEDGKGLEGLGANLTEFPEILPPVAKNSPQALKIALDISSLALTEYAIDCSDSYATCPTAGSGSDVERNICLLAADVKCRFFSNSGPTQIKKILGNVDESMKSIQTKSNEFLPCIDPIANKDGFTYKDEVYEKFKSVEVEAKFGGFKDSSGAAKTVDLGFTYAISCLTGSESGSDKNWRGFGISSDENDNKVFTIADFGGLENDRNGGIATVDQDKNVNFWGIVSRTDAESIEDLQKSNALIHLKSTAKDGRIELAFAGKSVGPDCKMRMITNGKYLFAKVNANEVLHCNAGDADFKADRVFDACLKVDGANIASAAIADCTDENLTESQMTISAITNETVLTNEIFKLFPKPEGVPLAKKVYLPKKNDEGDTAENKPAN